jgi:hypothetical protein
MGSGRAGCGLEGSEAWPKHVVELYTPVRSTGGELYVVPAVRGKAKTALAAVERQPQRPLAHHPVII